jgi:hypothetical protein
VIIKIGVESINPESAKFRPWLTKNADGRKGQYEDSQEKTLIPN